LFLRKLGDEKKILGKGSRRFNGGGGGGEGLNGLNAGLVSLILTSFLFWAAEVGMRE
jgi:hypothetical protein